MLDVIKKMAGPAGKAVAVGQLLYKQFYKNEQDANLAYNAIYPSLRPTVAKFGRNSAEFNEILNYLVSMAPLGAKRGNFVRKYINNPADWQSLSSDPDDIPFGFWW